jgi:hypothetical protein
MISRAEIEAASDIIDDVTSTSIITIVRMTDVYKADPAYFADIADRIDEINGTIKAQQLNAALDRLETLGVGEVEINQSQTVGTDGLIWSQIKEREGLVSYILGVMYEAFAPFVIASTNTNISIKGNYATGRLPIDIDTWPL